MPETHVLLVYLAALAAVFLAPGPDMVLLLATAAGHGTRAGLRTALGFAAARYCHCLAAGLGLAALFATHPPLQSAVRAGGAAYLLWLAWKAVKAGENTKDDARHRALFTPDSTNLPHAPAGKESPEGRETSDAAATRGPCPPKASVIRPVNATLGASTADALRDWEPGQSNPSARSDAPSGPGQKTCAARNPSATPRDENASARWGEGMGPTKNETALQTARTPKGLWPDFSRGLLTNLFNPKALLFCGLFLPQFVSSARGALLPQFLLLGAMLVVVGLAFDAVYAFMAGGLPGMLQRRRKTAAPDTPDAGESWSGRARRWLMGSVFAALAARLVAG